MFSKDRINKSKKWRIHRNPEKYPIKIFKNKIGQKNTSIEEDNIDLIEEKPMGYIERINQLSQRIQLMVEEEERDEKQYKLLKMMQLDDIDAEFVINNLGVTESELKTLVDELIERGFIQYVPNEEVELTEVGIRYIKWRDIDYK